MFTAVTSVLQLVKDRTATIQPLSDAAGRFNEMLALIARHEAQYTTAAAGATSSKKNAADALIAVTLRAANALFVLGNNTGNERLKAECRLTLSDLRYTRELTMIKICVRIAGLAKQHAPELVAFGITDSVLGSLAAAIESFYKARDEQQQRITICRSARLLLYKDMAVAAGILKNEIDPLMEIAKAGDTGFYNQYRATRKIKNLHGRTAKNGQTGETLEASPSVSPPAPALAIAA
jgi:hypothetical protein